MCPDALIGFDSGCTISCPAESPGSGSRFSRNVLPAPVESFQPVDTRGKNCRLQFIETAVQPGFGMLVPFHRPAVSQRFYPLRDFFRICNESASVAFGAEILGGIKTKGATGPECAGVLPVPNCAVRLGAILQEVNFFVLTEGYPALHLSDLSVQVDQQYRFGSRC